MVAGQESPSSNRKVPADPFRCSSQPSVCPAGNDLLEYSPYEPVNSRLSDIFRLAPIIAGKMLLFLTGGSAHVSPLGVCCCFVAIVHHKALIGRRDLPWPGLAI